ncbi:hypothetical protein BGZ95_009116 [Linnemannia exigua]|uniref:Uncharacterized protein n=1 Tax=Linnemannia exigua TaxID=604196 RepID=A0AAD4DDE6_9FUNG|nr:hypothetical protein BGZ95_009116 [Linnemannia exigua]
MNSGTSDSTSALQGDIEILRQELLNMEAKRDALLRQIEQEEQSIEEGVTLFNGDEFDQQDWSQYDVDDILEGPKDAGIRFDTFAVGKYFEPYYIMLRTTSKDKNNNTQDGEDDQLDNRRSTFEIAKHTLPHWIPLRETEKRYLNRDMSTFTRNVSGYLQSFVARRENVIQIIEIFTLGDSLLKAAAEAVTAATVDDEATPNQGHITLPQITCQTKDAAIRDVVFNCFRYNTLFTLYSRRQAREQKKMVEKSTKSASAPGSGFSSTTATTNISMLLGNHDIDMDIDTEDIVEETEEQREQKEDLELLGQHEPNLSAQIHLIYDDLQSTTPSRADVQFSKDHDLIRLETLSAKDPLRAQHARWTKLLIKSYSLIDAMKSIADFQNS